MKRPVCLTPAELRAADTPRIIRYLLATALRRLRQGRAIEERRDIIFPELSVIAKDVLRLANLLEGMTAARAAAGTNPNQPKKRLKIDL